MPNRASMKRSRRTFYMFPDKCESTLPPHWGPEASDVIFLCFIKLCLMFKLSNFQCNFLPLALRHRCFCCWLISGNMSFPRFLWLLIGQHVPKPINEVISPPHACLTSPNSMHMHLDVGEIYFWCGNFSGIFFNHRRKKAFFLKYTCMCAQGLRQFTRVLEHHYS